jgi:hypothetical protein
MKYLKFTILILQPLVFLYSCRKEVEEGTRIRASGYAIDTIKNKRLANVKLYLFGAHQTFYGIYYSDGPLDSTITDAQGKFSINYRAEGRSIDYALETSYLGYGGFENGPTVNYAADNTQSQYRFNYQTEVQDVVIKARELNHLKLTLRVEYNPYDTLYVSIWGNFANFYDRHLLKGQHLDTVLYTWCLPNAPNYIDYRAEGFGGDSGWISRRMIDSLHTNLADTIITTKKITSTYAMPLAF